TGGSAKIDAAYSYGGAAAAIATVERNFHVHIDEYAWIGLKGLIRMIDELGGVDVIVSNPVLDDFYPDDIDVTYLYAYKRVAILFDIAKVRQILLLAPSYTSDGQISAQSVILPHWAQILPVVNANFPWSFAASPQSASCR